MAEARLLWEESYWDDRTPAFPCPRCDRGNLSPNSPLVTEYSTAAANYLQSGDADPLDITYRFTQMLKCGVHDCGEIVATIGDAELFDRDNIGPDEDRYHYKLSPRGMHPAPPLATIPLGTPEIVANELKLAFHFVLGGFGILREPAADKCRENSRPLRNSYGRHPV